MKNDAPVKKETSIFFYRKALNITILRLTQLDQFSTATQLTQLNKRIFCKNIKWNTTL